MTIIKIKKTKTIIHNINVDLYLQAEYVSRTNYMLSSNMIIVDKKESND